jgi:XTP/dITP diphosphohydrolase
MAMRRLLVATNNSGKVRELRALLDGLALSLLTPNEAGLSLAVIEDGSTYIANASKKAKAFASASGLPALADDSGLEVAVLNGAPGLYSARYLGRHDSTDSERRSLLLQNLKGKPRPWTAKFRCAVALATPDGHWQWAEGECQGEIVPEERGSEGFGYDPIFLVEGTGKTMAELGMDEKNRLSHRARAVMQARIFLEALIGA